MRYALQDLIDPGQLQALQDALNGLTIFPSAVVDLDGEVITASGWQDLCTQFHRRHPATREQCRASALGLLERLQEGQQVEGYRCPHGLIHNGIPILVEGQHLGNVYTGQIFLEPPDLQFYRRQARQYGFEEEPYLAAVQRVPVLSPEQLERHLELLRSLAQSLSQMASLRLRQFECERAFKLVADNSPDTLLRVGAEDLLIRYISPACRRLLGREPEDFIGRPALSFVHPDDLPVMRSAIREMRVGETSSYTVRLACADGSYTWVEVDGNPVLDELTGTVVEIHGACRDVSERRHQEQRNESVTRLLATLAEINQAALGAGGEQGFLEAVCRIAGQRGLLQYVQAWLTEGEAPALRPGAQYGPCPLPGGLPSLSRWQELVDASFTTLQPQVAPLREQGLTDWTLALLPLAWQDKPQGLLALLGQRQEPPAPEVQALLGELAVDVSSVLAALEQGRRRWEVEQGLELALEGAQLGTWAWYIETGQLFVNERWTEMVGYRAEELTPAQTAWEQLLHPEDRPQAIAALQSHLRGETPAYESEHRLRTKSGQWLWVLDRGRVVQRAPDGSPLRAAGTLLDITVRKRTAEALLQERRRFQDLAELLPLGIFECNLAGQITYANLAAMELFGYADEEQADGTVYDFLVPAERGAAQDYVRALIEGRAERDAIEYHAVRRDGSVFPLQVHLTVIRSDGELTGLRGVLADISDLRRREEQLRFSQERFEKAFHASPDAITITRLSDGAMVEVNRGFEEITGYRRHEVLGLNTRQIQVWVDVAQRDEYLTTLRRDGELRDRRYQFRAKSGAVIEGLMSAVTIVLGDEPHVLSTIRDVTEQLRAQEALRESEANYRGIVENLHGAAFFRIGNDGRLLLHSPSLATVLGYDASESLVGRLSRDFWVHPEQREAYLAALAERDGRLGLFETELRQRDGRIIHTMLSTSYYRGSDGEPLGTEGMMLDITERRLMEDELRRTQEAVAIRNNIAQILLASGDQTMFSRVLEAVMQALQSEAGIFGYLDSEGRFLAAALALNPQSPGGRFAEGIRIPPEHQGPLLQFALSEGRTLMSNSEQPVPPGHAPLHRAIASPLISQDTVIGAIYLANRETDYLPQHAELLEALSAYVAPVLQARIERDRQEQARREAEEERRRLESQLQHTQRLESLGVLAAGIAHDFNNILTGIVMGTERAISASESGEDPVRRLRQVLSGAERARELVRQILAASAQAPLQQQPLRLQDVVTDAVGLARASLPSTVDFASDIAAEDLVVLADHTQLHQVILNMCTNAEYAMRPAGGVLRLGATAVELDQAAAGRAGALQPGRYACITVADTGCGMDAVTCDRIFEPFFTTKPSGDGVGMGLATSYGIVSAHGGAITVDSAPGQGTVFQIYLPLLDVKPETEQAEAEPVRGGQGRIVFVEDEPAIAGIAGEVLTALGYQPQVFPNALQALEYLRGDPAGCDLIVTDQTMPGMKGLDFIAEARQLGVAAPAVLMTGQATHATRQAAEELGIAEVLSKPYGAHDLAQTVHRALEGNSAGGSDG